MIFLQQIKSSVTYPSSISPLAISFQQVRHVSRRKLAYPPKHLGFRYNGRMPKKNHKSNFRFMMNQFLGPQNYKGEYRFNIFSDPQTNNETKFITRELPGDSAVVLPENSNVEYPPINKRFLSDRRKFQPFFMNPQLSTNLMLTDKTKRNIYEDVEINKIPVYELAFKYNIKIPRIEAVVKLEKIKLSIKAKNDQFFNDLKKMSSTMKKIFPLFERHRKPENLTEIPAPAKTLQSRFLTINESEPFGPVDAAKVFGIKSGKETLQDIAETEHKEFHHEEQKEGKEVYYAPVLEGEKSVFRFVKSKVGKVGHRYGASNRDNKTDRKIGFDTTGRMVYI
ncbi:mitochondrial 37S ribosomal protein mS45 ASCRUDRAFT_32968 [Ascoidea rubescens DSM 1968]|uniref:37S ribosomal protein S35, mitochondrial n=1 Tax=Ascoidea rubescens DSM 1968 TaxID=1344418 RepID=A0A1D2VJJ7_9ASCO|nr:hypothetical protein ASCRUDRAFT_32968 [Ascoidea rubescens DSM 1968]ODV61786.1 hypothetical protein ASCRUDRAFT_32968 [Ascoidea rubescens DSM 1968]